MAARHSTPTCSQRRRRISETQAKTHQQSDFSNQIASGVNR
ncbi:hypothetical protein T261_06805 [Streptomyces lydicus]|nr:hypothetical protein T261_06805 [Streptomyces lydicus]